MRLRSAIPLLSVLLALPLAAQDRGRPVVIVTGQDPTLPIPTLIAATVNQDVAEQLFLRLAVPGDRLQTAGDGGFRPQLARSWKRLDARTLRFDLDPRARWHDGTPVTSADVVFTFARARDRALSPLTASVLDRVSEVTADGPQRVVIRFASVYPEQFYDATYHVMPLPAHLLANLPPEQLAQSAYAKAPVGNGPFRWGRRAAGEFVELRANPEFFLGPVGPSGVIFRVATDADARLNLMLSGDGDGYEAVVPPAENRARIESSGLARTIAVPTLSVAYLSFNQRAADRAAAHPILGDVRVRRALVHALDRRTLAQALYAGAADLPIGPASQLLWPREAGARPSAPFDVAAARRLLREAGWQDGDGDGLLERNGEPLTLRLIAPASSYVRRQMAQIAEQQWKAVGVRTSIELLEPSVFLQRRRQGTFDVSAESVTQDPSPGGLVQSWTCTGGGNVTGFCDPQADSLLAAARSATGTSPAPWRRLLRRLDDQAPAAFLAAPAAVVAISRRVTSPVLVPGRLWSGIWRWTVAPR